MTKESVCDNGTRPTKELLRHSSHTIRPARRNCLWIAAFVPVLMACARANTEGVKLREGGNSSHHSGRIPVGALRIDARTDKRGVTLYDERGKRIAGASLFNLKSVSHLNFPGGERGVPGSIRVTWLNGPFSSDSNGYWTGGTLAGDYTAPVAERIPAEVIDYLRTKGGSLRLKIRLVDTGVLIGWDIETRIVGQAQEDGRVPSAIHYVLAGGDFCERQIYAGKVVEPGWEHAPRSIDNLAQGNRSR